MDSLLTKVLRHPKIRSATIVGNECPCKGNLSARPHSYKKKCKKSLPHSLTTSSNLSPLFCKRRPTFTPQSHKPAFASYHLHTPRLFPRSVSVPHHCRWLYHIVVIVVGQSSSSSSSSSSSLQQRCNHNVVSTSDLYEPVHYSTAPQHIGNTESEIPKVRKVSTKDHEYRRK